MKFFNRAKGAYGETVAFKYLKNKKYKILQENYKNIVGEIDIVAKDGEYIVFVEVKNRSTCAFGRPCEAVDSHKQYKIRRVAEGYLKEKHLIDSPCRFDVIEVFDDEINHIENAF